MPLLSIAASFNNRNRQLLHDNMSIQLPLIETNQSRVIIHLVINILLLIM